MAISTSASSLRPESVSLASSLALAPVSAQQQFLASLSDEEAAALLYEWPFWARKNQLPPAVPWRFWVIKAGRGFGKTRSGAEWVRAEVESGRKRRIALVNDTAADVRDVMIEGPAGILSVCPPWALPHYEPSKRRVTWANGAVAIAYAAETPELLRGPEHDGAWPDEPAKWKNLRKRDEEGGTAWDNLLLGLRVGDQPQCVVTTTPRAIPWMRDILKHPQAVVTTGTSYDNRANLSPDWFAEIISKYEGTRLGRQELYAEILTDTPGALWTQDQIEKLRVREMPCPAQRIVIAVDPSGSDKPDASEAGIIAATLGTNGHGYVLHDLSGHYTPAGWGAKAVEHYHLLKADRIVGEQNYGGQMVEHTIRTVATDRPVAYRHVTASRGKQLRAEPISALYEQGRVHHVGLFPDLEDELCNWVPGMKSPNRLDALVWALTDLMLGAHGGVVMQRH